MALYNNETVSVITPVYNVAKVIERTLDSMLMQDYKDLEIVLVDDCSKDNFPYSLSASRVSRG